MFGERHHFISYSTVEAQDFVYQLHDKLEGESPKIPAWLDKRDLKAAMDWDIQIAEAIRDCDSLLFVMTPDGVADTSVCKLEWSLALKYKKPIVPLLLKKCDAPFRLLNRQYIDFSSDFDAGVAKLREHLRWLASPQGELQRLTDQLADAERDLRRATDKTDIKRIASAIADLKQLVMEQANIVSDPKKAAARTQESIERGLERERQPEKPISAAHTSKFINPPPGNVPDYFQDRHVETQIVADFLRHDTQRLFTIVGRGGIGKTVMVCRLLKGLESGKLPDDLPTMAIDGIVYLSENGSRKANVTNLFSDLGKLLPKDTAAELEGVYKNPQATTESKVQRLLEAFPQGRFVLLLDNFEDVLDEQRKIKDAELDDALKTVLNAPQHGIKVIITTRVAARELMVIHPERQQLPALEVDQGLGSPDAENVLRAMDSEGTLGLKQAAEATLKNACERVRGYPRALEALVAALAADRETTLDDILKVADEQLPENVIMALVGEAFNRLEPAAQKVMQALAAYGRPVSDVALDYLLQPYMAGINSPPLLGRLVNMHVVRREAGLYYLHPVDRQYALSRLPKGEDSDRFEQGTAPLTQVALFHRGAEYYSSLRKPRAQWKKLEDLRPQLDEFDLRGAAGDWDTAAAVLTDIDFDYLLLWGHYRLLVSLHERLQGKIADWKLARISIGNLGSAYYSLGDVQQAITCYEQALQSAREHDDRQGTGVWLGNLGNAYNDLGQVEKAIDYYEQALTVAREIGDKGGKGRHLGNLGNAYRDLGQVEKAIAYYEQALVIDREMGDKRGEGTWLGNLGLAYSDLGQVEKAVAYYEQALTIAREMGDKGGEGRHLGNLGLAYSDLGQVEKAIDYYEQALVIDREMGDKRGEGTWLGSLGIAYYTLGQVEKAVAYYEQALVIDREIGDKRGEGTWLGNLGLAYSDLGQVEKAVAYYEQALTIAREIGDKRGEGNWLGNLAECLIEVKRYAEALQHALEAIKIGVEIGNPRGGSYGYTGVALAHLYSGDLMAAREAAQAASHYDVPENNFNVFALLGVIALRQGDVEAARGAFSEALAKADAILAQTAQLYDALDAKGTALCGLALCTQNAPDKYIEQAQAAFRAARDITKAKGIVGRVVRLFDALALAHTAGVLVGVRSVAAGEEG